MMTKIFAIAAVLAFAAAPAFARGGGGGGMHGGDFGAAVSGKTIQGSMNSSGHYTEYYAADGTLKGKDYTGNWRINDKDQLCVTYSFDPNENCWHGRLENNTLTWMRDGEDVGTGLLSDGDTGGYRDDDAGRR